MSRTGRHRRRLAAAFIAAMAASTMTGASDTELELELELVPHDLRPGSAFQSAQLRAMQDDPNGNPALLWLSEGESLWQQAGVGGPSCAGCHGEAPLGMRGVASRYPAIDESSGQLMNLELRINACRQRHQGEPPLAYESDALLALTAHVAIQSQGLPMAVDIDGAAQPWFERGRAFFASRQGQLNLACRHCHQQNWGRRLRGEVISQGHGTGYPAYRLEWQALGSLHRRLRSCSAGVRAEMLDLGSDDYLALELFLAWRASGLPLEAPAIRR